MSSAARHGLLRLPYWSWAAPLLALMIAGLHFYAPAAAPAWLMGPVLIAAVLAAVLHAEVVADRVGQPYGTLVLALAVTVIEAGLIIVLMTTGNDDDSPLARNTVFAAAMINLNAIVGLSMLSGASRFREQEYQVTGTSAALAALSALTVLTLILPNATAAAPGPYYAPAQLMFVAVVSVALYLTFMFVQTVRNPDHFEPRDTETPSRPRGGTTIAALLLMAAALAGVVLLGEALAPAIEDAVAAMHAPKAVVAIIIAMIVMLPEGLAAVRAARADQLQTSLNIALGSALASIGLTIPAVAVIALANGLPLALGLGFKDEILLALSLFTAGLSLSTGRATALQGAVHLTIFAVYLFMTVVP